MEVPPFIVSRDCSTPAFPPDALPPPVGVCGSSRLMGAFPEEVPPPVVPRGSCPPAFPPDALAPPGGACDNSRLTGRRTALTFCPSSEAPLVAVPATRWLLVPARGARSVSPTEPNNPGTTMARLPCCCGPFCSPSSVVRRGALRLAASLLELVPAAGWFLVARTAAAGGAASPWAERRRAKARSCTSGRYGRSSDATDGR